MNSRKRQDWLANYCGRRGSARTWGRAARNCWCRRPLGKRRWRFLIRVIGLLLPHRISDPAQPVGDHDVTAPAVLLAAMGPAIEEIQKRFVFSNRSMRRLEG